MQRVRLLLDVESRAVQDKISRVWHKLRGKMDAAIERGEDAILIGNLNRPLQMGIPSSFGTKLLELWLEGESVTKLNYRQISTRFDSATGKGSLLDIGIISNNIRKAVSNFEVDTENKWTPFSMNKNAQKTIIKKSSDHRSVSFNVTLPCILTNNKKRPVINFKNPEGWERYKKIFDAHAQKKRSGQHPGYQ